MSKKKAFVFDTNFIIQVKSLDKVIEKLGKEFVVFVSQVSIDERIAQECRCLKEKFEKAEASISEIKNYASIAYKIKYEKAAESYSKAMQLNYSKHFKDRIIPFSKDEKTFVEVIDRANKRIPPFSSAKDASDKGFKDCLLWLSLLEYFKVSKEQEIVFATDDRAFRDNASILTEEFFNATSKKITIVPNSFYAEKDKPKLVKKQDEIEDMAQKINFLREQFNTTLKAFCGREHENDFGEKYQGCSFITYKQIDKHYLKEILEHLEEVILNNIFKETVSASDVFGNNPDIIDGPDKILTSTVVDLNKLFLTIKNERPELLDQFYKTAVTIVNKNFRNKPIDTPTKRISYDDYYSEPPF